MDEFALIRRCFRDRARRRPGTVLGIGDDAALLDTGGLSLAHACATVQLSASDDPRALAFQVFGTAFIRLAAKALTPRWATLGLTHPSGDPDWIEAFADTVSATSDACRVELISGDTTRGHGRATVFALGAGSARSRRDWSRRPAATVAVRVRIAAADAPAMADLVSTLVALAQRGTEIRCDEVPVARAGMRALELTVHADTAAATALHAVSRRRRAVSVQLESGG